MHIEPGIVDGAKAVLSYATGTAALFYAAKLVRQALHERGLMSVLSRTVATTALVFCFFEVLPHYPVGVSEVHLILGSTLLLVFGAAPAAVGLGLGLLLQGLLFAPFDLPQYGMNVTTLLVPLFTLKALSERVIAPQMPYVEVGYGQALVLSTAYQAGIVCWVAFWAFYGAGLTFENAQAVASFGGAYLLVILIEPLVDLAVLACAKLHHSRIGRSLLEQRLYNPA